MTDFSQSFSLLCLFETLVKRVFHDLALRSRRSLSMGLLRFSLKNESFIKLEP